MGGKDLPKDARPVADEHYYFDHPYPAVQDNSDYDRDFVKDENQDGGKWKAQMLYDTLRQKVRLAEKELEALKKAKDAQESVMKDAKTVWEESKIPVKKAMQPKKRQRRTLRLQAKRSTRLKTRSTPRRTVWTRR